MSTCLQQHVSFHKNKSVLYDFHQIFLYLIFYLVNLHQTLIYYMEKLNRIKVVIIENPPPSLRLQISLT